MDGGKVHYLAEVETFCKLSLMQLRYKLTPITNRAASSNQSINQSLVYYTVDKLQPVNTSKYRIKT